MNAKSIKGASAEEIRTALNQAMADGFKPTLATVFMSIKQDRAAICRLMDEHGIAVFGATTGGEFIDGDLGSGSIAILLMDLDPAYFTILQEEYKGKDATAVAAEMTRAGMRAFARPAFILSHGFHLDTELALAENIIDTINRVAGPDAEVWGGAAGDDFAFKSTVVFDTHRAVDQGIIMLVLDTDHVIVKGQSTTGHQAVGTEKTVTRAVNNWVYTLDDQPAADMVLKYLGITLTPEELETFTPGVIVLSVSRGKGEPVFRSSAMFNWTERSIAVTSGIKEGDRIRLTLPPDFDTIDEAARQARAVQLQEMPEADALLMFSCIGRLGAFGPLTGEEVAGVKNVFGAPMAGFFSYGEFGRATNGNNELHNMTCCWVALKEKQQG